MKNFLVAIVLAMLVFSGCAKKEGNPGNAPPAQQPAIAPAKQSQSSPKSSTAPVAAAAKPRQQNLVPDTVRRDLASADLEVRKKALAMLIDNSSRTENESRVFEAMRWLSSQPDMNVPVFTEVAGELGSKGFLPVVIDAFLDGEGNWQNRTRANAGLLGLLVTYNPDECRRKIADAIISGTGQKRGNALSLSSFALTTGSSKSRRDFGLAMVKVIEQGPAGKVDALAQHLRENNWTTLKGADGITRWLTPPKRRKTLGPMTPAELQLISNDVKSPSQDVQRAAIEKLVLMANTSHVEAIPLLTNLLTLADNPFACENAREALSTLATRGFATEVAREMLKVAPRVPYEQHRYVHQAMYTAALRGDRVEILDEVLLPALADTQADVNQLSLLGIVEIGKEEDDRFWIIGELSKVLSTGSPMARQNAANALMQLGVDKLPDNVTRTARAGNTGPLAVHLLQIGELPTFLVGFGATTWGPGQGEYLTSLEPIYRGGKPGEHPTGSSGFFPADPVIIEAKEGYAVGALVVMSDIVVRGFRITFMRIVDDNHLDPKDSYQSPWIGTRIHGQEQILGGDGRPVIGFYSDSDRQTLMLWSFGLIQAKASSRAKVSAPSDRQ